MKYAILVNREIADLGAAKDLWPNTSFISGPDAFFLADKGAVVVQTTRAFNAETEALQNVEAHVENGAVYTVQVIPKPEEAPVPNWSGFSAALIADASFESIYGEAFATNPLKSAAVISGFQHAEAGDSARFLQTWQLWKPIANIEPEYLDAFKELAALFHIPQEIIDEL
jgi:hypothetical protein